MRGTRLGMLSSVGVAAILIAGCSSSSKAGGSDSPTKSSAPTSSAQALSGAPVTLGVITDASGSTGENQSMTETSKRWVQYVNSHGGVNGHPVKVIVKDTKNNAATALQVAKELVE